MYHIIYMFFSMNCNLCTTLEKHFNQINTRQLFGTETFRDFKSEDCQKHQWKHYNNLATQTSLSNQSKVT